MSILDPMKRAWDRLLYLAGLLLASLLLMGLLPLLLLGLAMMWPWRVFSDWRVRRAFDARFRPQGKQAVEFNPAAIVIPEKGSVRVIRFWQAYRDHKHGKPGLLQEKEQELFDALDTPGRASGQAP